MADNVEKFILKFVSEDRKVVEGIKRLSKSLDGLNKKQKRQAQSQNKLSNQASKKQQEENALLRKRKQLRDAITRADKLGLNVKGYERTLAQAKKQNTLERRTLELNDLISRKNRENVKLGKMKAVEAQKNTNLVKQETAAQERLNQQKKKSVRLSKEAAATRTQRVTSTKMFDQARTQNPRRAGEIERALGVNFQRNTEKSKQNVIALRAEVRRLSEQYRRTARSAGLLRTSQTGLQDSTRNLIRTYASLFAVLGATHQINKAGQSFEAMESAMLAAMGTKEDAAKQIQFLDKTTSKLGLSLLDTADQYTKFTFAAKGKMPTEEINEFFKSMAEAGTVLGVSKERMKLSFNAVQQITSV